MISAATFPAWADQRRAYCERAGTSHKAKHVTRYHVRERAALLGLDAPEWATKQIRSVTRGELPYLPDAKEVRAAAVQGHAAPQSAASPARGKRLAGQRTAAKHRVRVTERSAAKVQRPNVESCTPVAMPPELRSWRERHPGSIVVIGQAGVTLYPFGCEPRKFNSPAHAVAYVQREIEP
jgi:hypothetical protein